MYRVLARLTRQNAGFGRVNAPERGFWLGFQRARARAARLLSRVSAAPAPHAYSRSGEKKHEKTNTRPPRPWTTTGMDASAEQNPPSWAKPKLAATFQSAFATPSQLPQMTFALSALGFRKQRESREKPRNLKRLIRIKHGENI